MSEVLIHTGRLFATESFHTRRLFATESLLLTWLVTELRPILVLSSPNTVLFFVKEIVATVFPTGLPLGHL